MLAFTCISLALGVSLFEVSNAQLGIGTQTPQAQGTRTVTGFAGSTPISLSPQTASLADTANPSIITFYLPSPIVEVGAPVTSIASVSLVGSGSSDGAIYTTFVEERVVEIAATTMSTLIDGTPVETALASGTTTTITGTMVISGQSWTFSAPDYGNLVENCTLSGSSSESDTSLQNAPSLECSYQSTNNFGGSFGNALGEYTLTLDSDSVGTVSPSRSSSSGSGVASSQSSASDTSAASAGAHANSGTMLALESYAVVMVASIWGLLM
ncbi:hypothetical protein EV361DRAFT_960337 [Lentinula raphanica]|nr:hypothetical protein EV361DRAFT_960337 [Lentinula raphanica]